MPPILTETFELPILNDGQDHGDVRVLHVDDEEMFREMTVEFLEREAEAIDVVGEPDAAAALARLEECDERIDCVVSDYEMPGMDGLEFLDALRDRGHEVPFLLFTGKGSESIASRAISAGVTDYLQKSSAADNFTLLANRIENAVEQFRAARRAESVRRRLTQLAESSTDVLWLFAGDWDELLFVNSAYEDLWERSIERLREDPRDFLAGVHPGDRTTVEGAMETLAAGGSVDFEFRLRTDDDRVKWVWVQGKPLYDGDEVARVTGFARDVTGRKEREQNLETFREAVENAGHSIYWTDRAGTIEYVNPAFEATTGFTPEEAIGSNPRILKSGVHDDEFYADLWETIADGDVWESEVVNERKDGERYVVEQTIAPILDDDGRPERFVAINSETSERK